MIRKDYIQRYFDELSKVLAAVLQLKDNHQPKEANQQLDHFSNNYLGFDLNTVAEFPLDQLISILIQKYEFTTTHFKLLEDLLYHKYLLNTDNKNMKAATLEVMNFLLKEDTDFSFSRKNRIVELSD